MSNKQRHWLLVIAALVFGAVTVASIAYAQFNPQPDPPARSKKNTNDLKQNDTRSAIDGYKGGDKTIHIVPGSDKNMGWDVRSQDKSLPAHK